MLARLQAAQTLFVFEPAALRSLRSSKASLMRCVQAQRPTTTPISGTFAFACANAAAVRSVDLGGLLDAFKRIARIDAQIVTGSGQSKPQLEAARAHAAARRMSAARPPEGAHSLSEGRRAAPRVHQ